MRIWRMRTGISITVSPSDRLRLEARRILPLKNTLLAEDALRLEAAFAARMPEIATSSDEPVVATETPTGPQDASNNTAPDVPLETDKRLERRRSKKVPSETPRIDKSVLAFPEPRRIRDKERLRFVGRQPCLICGRMPSDAHHIRFAQLHALGRKVSDEFTVPICRSHHRELHRHGNEQAWWERTGLDPLKSAASLWRKSHAIPAAIVR